MVILGATTGLRLMDCSRLTWKAISLERGVIEVTTQKTGAELTLPIHSLLAQWLSEQPRGIGKAPLFPALHQKPRGGKNGLCPSFQVLMQKAGIAAEMAHTGTGKGRNKSKKSFHSLRHFISTQLAQSGTRQEISRAITGHADAATHAHYITPDVQALRSAVDSIRLTA
jgi:integrase